MPTSVAQSYTYSEVAGGDTSVLFVGSNSCWRRQCRWTPASGEQLRAFPNLRDRVQMGARPALASENASGQVVAQGQFNDVVQGLDVSLGAGMYFATSGTKP